MPTKQPALPDTDLLHDLPANIDFGHSQYVNGYNDALALCRQIVVEHERERAGRDGS